MSFPTWPDAPRLLEVQAHPHVVHLLTVQAASGLPETVHATMQRFEAGWVILGSLDALELTALRHELSRVNSELYVIERQQQKQNRELVRLSELKNRFLGIAAHDLRGPLEAIAMNAQWLQEDPDDLLTSDRREALESIGRSAADMARLVDDLLDTSAFEAGKISLDLVALDLGPFLKQAAHLHARLASCKQIDVVMATPAALPLVTVDRRRLTQVLDNLLSNAVKFSNPDTVVQLSVRQEAGELIVEVRDHGPGIPVAEHAGLFQPFGRTSVNATAGERSTGLGLYIARMIVLAHRGRFWIDSVPGKGSSFYFSLPVAAGGGTE